MTKQKRAQPTSTPGESWWIKECSCTFIWPSKRKQVDLSLPVLTNDPRVFSPDIARAANEKGRRLRILSDNETFEDASDNTCVWTPLVGLPRHRFYIVREKPTSATSNAIGRQSSSGSPQSTTLPLQP